jgi:COP9 signalosome complex subunit 6
MRVVGVILGRQSGRNVEIVNSIELQYEEKDGSLIIDEAYAKSRIEQYQIMYKDLSCVGWYSSNA